MDEYSNVSSRILQIFRILPILPIQDFLQFAMTVFNKAGKIKPSLYQPGSLQRGTGVWGKEINHGTLAYVEEIRVNSKHQRKGVGRWAIENMLSSDSLRVRIFLTSLFFFWLTPLKHCPYIFLWATPLNINSFFEGPDPDFNSKKRAVISFWRSVGFRRVAGTWFFGYARNPEHPMRSLKMDEDAEETQTVGYNPSDAFDACVTVIYE